MVDLRKSAAIGAVASFACLLLCMVFAWDAPVLNNLVLCGAVGSLVGLTYMALLWVGERLGALEAPVQPMLLGILPFAALIPLVYASSLEAEPRAPTGLARTLRQSANTIA